MPHPHTFSGEDKFFPKATFWEHCQALRQTFIYSLFALAIGILLSLFFYSFLLNWILGPLESPSPGLQSYEIKHRQVVNTSDIPLSYSPPLQTKVMSQSSGVQDLGKNYLMAPGSFILIAYPDKKVHLFSPLEGMRTTLKICFWSGLIISSPFWLFFIARYVLPALFKKERHLFICFLLFSLLFLSGGAAFAYYITIPLSNEMLGMFNEEIGTNLWSFSQYVDYTFILMLANSLVFEMGLLLFLLVHFGFLSAEAMAQKRKHVIVGAFIMGALLTPPDVLTQVMVAIPLIILYEISMLYGKYRTTNVKAS